MFELKDCVQWRGETFNYLDKKQTQARVFFVGRPCGCRDHRPENKILGIWAQFWGVPMAFAITRTLQRRVICAVIRKEVRQSPVHAALEYWLTSTGPSRLRTVELSMRRSSRR